MMTAVIKSNLAAHFDFFCETEAIAIAVSAIRHFGVTTHTFIAK